MHWLLDEGVLAELREAHRAGRIPSADEERAFFAERGLASDGSPLLNDDEPRDPRILVKAGNVANIIIQGVLTERPRLFYSLFGGGNTSYNEIRAALASAETDDSIRSAVLHISSPGGNVDGFFETVEAIAAFSKPLSVRSSYAASAAYGLASAAGKIRATGKHAEFGSIGVAQTFFVFDDEVDITNTDSPAKRPDVTTDEGKAVVQKRLDGIADLFMEAIASGRTRAGRAVSKADVAKDFGRGAVLLATEARRLGMIDSIQPAAKPRSGVPMDAQENDDMIKILAQTLGLKDDADEAKILAAVGDLKRKGETAEAASAFVASIEQLTGKAGDEARGVVVAWKDGAEKATALQDELDKANEKLEATEKQAEADERDRLLAKAKDDQVITSDKQLEYWKGQPLASLKSYLEVASPAVPTREFQEPGGKPKEGDPTPATGTRHNGKTYAEMTGPERAALHESHPLLAEQMHHEYLASL